MDTLLRSSRSWTERVASLSAERKAALGQRVASLQNRWIPQEPTAPQAAFLLLETREALYGGAAGGGKSSAQLMAALQHADVPGYAALLLRRTFADLSLPGALMDRAHQWLGGTAARWSGERKTWTFPSGATLTFGYLETEIDKYRYQGSEFHYVGFDEVTQFTESQYRYLLSRGRRLAGSKIPMRQRGSSNPGGLGHEWVRQRFLIEGAQQGRPFIPARLDDNPHLDRDEYRESLRQLDPVTRAQLENGDWTVRAAGNLFRREWFKTVDAAPAGTHRVRYWDLAATEPAPGTDPDWTVGALVAESRGRYTVCDVRRMRGKPGAVEALVRQTAEIDGPDVEVWIEQEPGSAGVNTVDHYQRAVLRGFSCRGNRPTGDKRTRANPVNAAAEAGNVDIVRGPWNSAFLDEIEGFPAGAHDDQVDGLSGAVEKLAGLGSGSATTTRGAPPGRSRYSEEG